jgi:peptidoglycan/xylan/chitin deacetylase (PgdA/CDA1 family)
MIGSAVFQARRPSVRRVDRRDTLRAVTALGVGALAGGCGTLSGPPVPARPAASPSPAAPLGGSNERPAAGPSPLPDEVVHGPRDRAAVALTFHGQGEPALVGRLLDEIAAGDARVTVLAVGTWLKAWPQLGHRIVEAGHELGNHTQHHADIKRMPAARAYAEIADCAHVLRSVTGTIGRWFRPSQTQHATGTIKAAAARVGYPTCLSYDVDSLDYTDPPPAAIVRRTLDAVRPGSVVSLHFGHAATVAAMPALLDGLRQRRLMPVTMTELMT